jgi:hypothetical protein
VFWLRLVLNIPSIPKVEPAYGTAQIETVPDTPLTINISFDISQYDPEEQPTPDPSYWLLRHSTRVIAYGFPIAARDSSQKGLEVTLPVLQKLSPTIQPNTGDLQICEWSEGLIMRGRSNLFIIYDIAQDSLPGIGLWACRAV